MKRAKIHLFANETSALKKIIARETQIVTDMI